MKNLAIDAHNIRSGGGLLYLKKILEHAEPEKHGFKKIFIWATKETLQALPKKKWLKKKKNEKILVQNKKKLVDFGIILRTIWHIFQFKKEAIKNNCDVAFFPGGINFSGFKRSAVINLNYLPFDDKEVKKFNFSIIYLRLKLLKIVLISSIKNSKGAIFLTSFFKKNLNKYLLRKKISVIEFGIEKNFFFKRKFEKNKFSYKNPFIIAYVSNIFPYKNHISLIKVISKIQNQKKIPIKLLIIGTGYDHTISTLKKFLKKNNIKKEKIILKGFLSDKVLKSFFRNKIDLKVFPSSCEAFPNILLEAGASCLPILCLKKQPYIEIFKNNILYFVDKNNDLEKKIYTLFHNNRLRNSYAMKIQKYVKNYTWKDCSNKTFSFLTNL